MAWPTQGLPYTTPSPRYQQPGARTMRLQILYLAILAAIDSRTTAFETDTLSSTISQCSTQYASSDGVSTDAINGNLILSYSYVPWLSTEAYTTTAYSNFAKTEVLTPRAITTTVEATLTTTSYETIRDTSTLTVYINTIYDSYTATQTESVTSTTTLTISAPATITIPTALGFIAVASANPGAALATPKSEIDTQWDVEDVWWTEFDQQIYYYDKAAADVSSVADGPLPTAIPVAVEETPVLLADLNIIIDREATDRQLARRLRLPYRPQSSDSAQKIICTYTVVNNYFMTTTTIKRPSAPTPTFTRTTIVATVTSTSTVRAKPTNGWNGTLVTEYVDGAFWSATTFSTTYTTTEIETVSSYI